MSSGENDTEREQIEAHLKTSLETDIRTGGNRNWGLQDDMRFFIICMKDWDRPECEKFINYLRKDVNWWRKNSVQVYYVPAFENNDVSYSRFDDRFIPFEYIKLFDE